MRHTGRHPRGVFCAAPTPVTEDLAPHHTPGRGGIGAAVRTDTARPAAKGLIPTREDRDA